jgi:hypothetical protein
MHDDPTLTPKEKSAVLVRAYVAEVKATMDTVLSYIEQAKLVPAEMVTQLSEAQRKLDGALWNLRARPVPKERTPEEQVKHEAYVAKCKEQRERKSDVQECVDAWLREQLEEFDLKPELMDEDEAESFTYEITETMNEYRSGEVEFEVPDLVKERLDAMMGDDVDFNDALKEHLDEKCHGDFYIDTEYGDGEMVESGSELR